MGGVAQPLAAGAGLECIGSGLPGSRQGGGARARAAIEAAAVVPAGHDRERIGAELACHEGVAVAAAIALERRHGRQRASFDFEHGGEGPAGGAGLHAARRRAGHAQRHARQRRRIVEDAAVDTTVFGAAVVGERIARGQRMPQVPGGRSDAVEIGPGIELPVIGPHRGHGAAHPDSAPGAAQADGGFVVPQRLEACAFALSGVELHSRAETKHQLDAAAQRVVSGECEIAALDRADLVDAVEATEDP